MIIFSLLHFVSGVFFKLCVQLVSEDGSGEVGTDLGGAGIQ